MPVGELILVEGLIVVSRGGANRGVVGMVGLQDYLAAGRPAPGAPQAVGGTSAPVPTTATLRSGLALAEPPWETTPITRARSAMSSAMAALDVAAPGTEPHEL